MICVAYSIVSGYQCSIWGARKDWWAYKVRLDMGYTKHNKEVTLCLLLICVPGAEQNKTRQPLWVLPDMDEEQAWCLQRRTGSQLACPLVGLELKNRAGSAQGYHPSTFEQGPCCCFVVQSTQRTMGIKSLFLTAHVQVAKHCKH